MRMQPLSFIILCLVVAVPLGLIAAGPNLLGWNKSEAEEHARTWAKETQVDLKSVSCNGVDTDGDGYVSCSFHFEGVTVPSTFECAGWTLLKVHSGCREPKIRIPERRPAR